MLNRLASHRLASEVPLSVAGLLVCAHDTEVNVFSGSPGVASTAGRKGFEVIGC